MNFRRLILSGVLLIGFISNVFLAVMSSILPPVSFSNRLAGILLPSTPEHTFSVQGGDAAPCTAGRFALAFLRV